MIQKQYFPPLDFTLQIAGFISSVNAHGKTLHRSPELPETTWEMNIGVNEIEVIQQISIRPNIRLIKDLANNESLLSSTNHVESDKFLDEQFKAEFVRSVRTSLSEQIPKVIAETIHVLLLSTFFNVADKYDIQVGDKTLVKNILKGLSQRNRQFRSLFDSSQSNDFLRLLEQEFAEAYLPMLDRLFKTKRGIKKGSRKTPKALMHTQRGRYPLSIENFLNELQAEILKSERTDRKSIARRFGISADALDDLRRKHCRDTRTWYQVVTDAKKNN